MRTRTNQELQQLCEDLDIVADIEKIGMYRTMVRTDHGRVVKKIFESELEAGGEEEEEEEEEEWEDPDSGLCTIRLRLWRIWSISQWALWRRIRKKNTEG
jgi:hypothetical protein